MPPVPCEVTHEVYMRNHFTSPPENLFQPPGAGRMIG